MEMPIRVIRRPYNCIGNEMNNEPNTAHSGNKEAVLKIIVLLILIFLLSYYSQSQFEYEILKN